MTDSEGVKGAELVRTLRRVGRTHGVEVYAVRQRGKGSHVTLHFGDRLAVIPSLSHELKTGTLRAILKQLGLGPDDLKG